VTRWAGAANRSRTPTQFIIQLIICLTSLAQLAIGNIKAKSSPSGGVNISPVSQKAEVFQSN
jgi:hypothetical protein